MVIKGHDPTATLDVKTSRSSVTPEDKRTRGQEEWPVKQALTD